MNNSHFPILLYNYIWGTERSV